MPKQENSMQQFDRLEDRIRQHRQVSKAPTLVVEGPKDKLLLGSLLPEVDVFPAGSKPAALRALRSLHSWRFQKFAVVFDVDFDDHSDLTTIGDAVHPYEGRDLESMLVGLGVLASILEFQGSAEKLKRLGGAAAVVDKAVRILAPVTTLRSANVKNGWGLSFDAVSVADKVNRKTLELGFEQYIRAVHSKSDCAITVSSISLSLRMVEDDGLGPRGKDILEVAGVALRSLAGTVDRGATTCEVLNGQLLSSAGLALSRTGWLSFLRSKLGLTAIHSGGMEAALMT